MLSSVLKLILRKGGQDRMSPCWKYASSISFLTKDVQSGRWDREGFPETPTGSRRDACLCLSSELCLPLGTAEGDGSQTSATKQGSVPTYYKTAYTMGIPVSQSDFIYSTGRGLDVALGFSFGRVQSY